MHYLFITGKLAAPALADKLAALAPQARFPYEIKVFNISVAALMTPRWVADHWPDVNPAIDCVIVPGGCTGDWSLLQQIIGIRVEKGPVDLRDLDEHFGLRQETKYDGTYSIEILAEINHAPRLAWTDLCSTAEQLRASGADVIDLGCEPGYTWNAIGDVVKRLRHQGCRVSVDSFDVKEVEQAVRAGAELVLSVNQNNLEASRDWGCEVVAIPDQPNQLETLDRTVERLAAWNVPHRLDPILEPIGMGFAASLGRYLETRRRFPNHAMLMGVGNLTELTEVDSAGVNALLIGFCQELNIGSVLTTQVIPWAQSCVAEIDVARRLMRHAVAHRTIPKKVDPRLVMLRDPKLRTTSLDQLLELSRHIKDRHFRIFAENGRLHLMNGRQYVQGSDAFDLFKAVLEQQAITPDHAFYLGHELAKAQIALVLGKNYIQDETLQWGLLTKAEQHHYLARGEGAEDDMGKIPAD